MLFFYKYGHHTEKDSFRGRYANEDEVLRFELTAETDLWKLRTDACFEEKSQFQLYSQDNLTAQLNWAAKTAPAKNYIIMLYGHGAGFNAKHDFYKESIAGTRVVLYDHGFNGRGMNMYEFKVWERMQGKTYKDNPYIGRNDLRHIKVLHWDHNDLCYKLFIEEGFEWGGDWTSCKDFQHFELKGE